MQHKHALYAVAPSPPEHASRNSLPESRPPPTNLMRVRTLLTRRALAGAPPVRRRMAHASARRRPQPLNAPLPHASCMALPTSRGPHPDRCIAPHLSRAGLADTIQQKQACCQFFACHSPVCPPAPGFAIPRGRSRGAEWRTGLPRRPVNQRRPGRIVHRRPQFGAGKNSYPGVKYMSAPTFTLLSTAAGAVCHGCSLDTARGEP